MAFTFDTSTDRGRVRRNIGDGDSAAYWYEDVDVDNALAEGGSVSAATVILLRGLLASKSLRAKRATVHGVSFDDTAQLDSIRMLLSMYGGDIPTAVVQMGARMDFDSGFIDPIPSVSVV